MNASHIHGYKPGTHRQYEVRFTHLEHCGDLLSYNHRLVVDAKVIISSLRRSRPAVTVRYGRFAMLKVTPQRNVVWNDTDLLPTLASDAFQM